MLELAQNILDIAENSIRAGASFISVNINENTGDNLLTIEISDNGCGMNEQEINNALDPFYSTKKVRRIGLGLPLLADAAREAGGKLNLQSSIGQGTKVTATFTYNHIDRQPLGNMTATLVTIIAANPDIDVVYNHSRDNRHFTLDTRLLISEINDISICHPQIVKYIRKTIKDGLRKIKTEAH